MLDVRGGQVAGGKAMTAESPAADGQPGKARQGYFIERDGLKDVIVKRKRQASAGAPGYGLERGASTEAVGKTTVTPYHLMQYHAKDNHFIAK